MQPLADNLPQILNFTQDLYPQLRCFVSNREIMKIFQIDVVTICQIYHKLTFKIAMLCHDICNQNSIKKAYTYWPSGNISQNVGRNKHIRTKCRVFMQTLSSMIKFKFEPVVIVFDQNK